MLQTWLVSPCCRSVSMAGLLKRFSDTGVVNRLSFFITLESRGSRGRPRNTRAAWRPNTRTGGRLVSPADPSVQPINTWKKYIQFSLDGL